MWADEREESHLKDGIVETERQRTRVKMRSAVLLGAVLSAIALCVVLGNVVFQRSSAHAGRAVRGAFRTGDRHRYALELDTQVQAGGGTLVDYALRGTWVVEVLDVTPQDVVLRGHIDQPKLDAKGRAAGPDVQSRLEQMA